MKKTSTIIPQEIIRTLLACLAFMFNGILLPITGQTTLNYSDSNEKVYVHLDKLVYITGEEIRYKVYSIDMAKPGLKICSKVLYFTLTGTKDKNVVSWRINLTDPHVSGSYTIPADIKSGMYVLTAYSNMMRNGPADSFFSRDLLIMNLTEMTPNSLMIGSMKDTSERRAIPEGKTGISLVLNTSKSVYRVNENVELEINLDKGQSQSAGADLSVSVTAETPFENILKGKDIVACMPVYSKPEKKRVSCLHPMEDRGFTLNGRVKSKKDNTPLAGGKILLSVIDSISPTILYAQTDATGDFQFYLDKMYDNQELILQLEDLANNADYYWEMDKKIVDARQRPYRPYVLKVDELEYLNTLKDIRIVDAIYTEKTELKQQPVVTGKTNYFGPPDAIIYPGDFADLVNFKEIADNIIPVAKFAIRNGEFYLQVLNTHARLVTWNENRIILLNGVPFNDLSYISTLGTKDIKRIEIITSNFFIGDLTLRGLMSIYTYDNRIPENYIKNNTLSFKNTVVDENGKAVKMVSGNNSRIAGEHSPDFRNTLYWKPDVTIANQKLVVNFRTSMLTGIFNIDVEGLTSDGFPVSGTATFEVKEQ